jgi:hypothetical protein
MSSSAVRVLCDAIAVAERAGRVAAREPPPADFSAALALTGATGATGATGV